MKIRFYISTIGVGLLFSSITTPMSVARGDDAQEKMTKFQKTVKTFQRKMNLYERCLKRKCSKEEKQQIKRDLKVASKNAAIYGGLTVAALHLIFGAAIVAKYGMKSNPRLFNEKSDSPEQEQVFDEKPRKSFSQEVPELVKDLFSDDGSMADLSVVTEKLGKLLGKNLDEIKWQIKSDGSYVMSETGYSILSGLLDKNGRNYIQILLFSEPIKKRIEGPIAALMKEDSDVVVEWKEFPGSGNVLLKITNKGQGEGK